MRFSKSEITVVLRKRSKLKKSLSANAEIVSRLLMPLIIKGITTVNFWGQKLTLVEIATRRNCLTARKSELVEEDTNSGTFRKVLQVFGLYICNLLICDVWRWVKNRKFATNVRIGIGKDYGAANGINIHKLTCARV